jgi:hypothetical protein
MKKRGKKRNRAAGRHGRAPAEQVPSKSSKPLSATPKTPLLDYFKSDFSRYLIIGEHRGVLVRDVDTSQELDTVPVEISLCVDIDAKSEFVALYIPHTPLTTSICAYLADDARTTVENLQHKLLSAESGFLGERGMELKDAQFSGRIFVYHEYPLFTSDIGFAS